MKLIAALALVLLTGCSTVRDCYVGFSLLPLGPIVTCGVDAYSEDEEEDEEEPLSV